MQTVIERAAPVVALTGEAGTYRAIVNNLTEQGQFETAHIALKGIEQAFQNAPYDLDHYEQLQARTEATYLIGDLALRSLGIAHEEPKGAKPYMNIASAANALAESALNLREHQADRSRLRRFIEGGPWLKKEAHTADSLRDLLLARTLSQQAAGIAHLTEEDAAAFRYKTHILYRSAYEGILEGGRMDAVGLVDAATAALRNESMFRTRGSMLSWSMRTGSAFLNVLATLDMRKIKSSWKLITDRLPAIRGREVARQSILQKP